MYQLKQSLLLGLNKDSLKQNTENYTSPVHSSTKSSIIETIQKNEQSHNSYSVIEDIQSLISTFSYQNQQLEINQKNFIEKINQSAPQYLMFQHQGIAQQQRIKKYKASKKIMQIILSINQSSIQQDKADFLDKNKSLQHMITQQMENIEALDQQLSQYDAIQEQKIVAVEKLEMQLKKLLKKKADLDQIDSIDKIRNKSVNDVRKVRQYIVSLKDKKANKIGAIIHQLQQLNEHRKSTLHKIDCKYFNNLNPENVKYIIQDFVTKFQLMLQYKQGSNMTPINQVQSARSNSYRKSLTSQTPLTVSQFQSNLNNNSIKQVHKLKSSIQPFTQKIAPIQSNQQSILLKYEQLIQQFQKIEKVRLNFIQKKKNDMMRDRQLRLLQRCYINGLLGIKLQQYSPEDYQQIIKDALIKCQNYYRIIGIKLKQKNVVQQKIKSIQKTKQTFIEILTEMSQTQQSKQKIYKKISDILDTAISQQQSSRLKDFHKQMQKLKIKKNMLEKELQQFAEEANLVGYKQNKIKIDEVQKQIAQLQNKALNSQHTSLSIQQYQKQLEDIINSSNFSDKKKLYQKIVSQDLIQMLAKAKKRLTNF